MADFTDFGKAVKHRLIDKGMTQRELMKLVSDKTGLYCDCSVLNKLLTGKNNRPKIAAAISEILEL